MRWFDMVMRVLLVGALVCVFGCANEGGVLPVEDDVVNDGYSLQQGDLLSDNNDSGLMSVGTEIPEEDMLLIPPEITRDEIISVAANDLGLEGEELEQFIKKLDYYLDYSATVDPAFFSGADDIAADRGCSYKRHAYYGSCQIGTVPWGPCNPPCSSCDHDWKMVYSKSWGSYSYQGSQWYYVPVSASAIAAYAYYRVVDGHGLTSDTYTSSSNSYRWMMMGDRAVNALFGGAVDYAGWSYMVYQKLCN